MRNVFLLLLLANLLVLAWEQWVERPAHMLNVTPVDDGIPALVYLSPRPPAGSEMRGEAEESLAQDSMRCVRVGPFRTEEAANLARNSLAGRVSAVDTLAIEGDVWVGHWVQIRDLPARAAAREVLTRLKDNGIGDAYIVPTEIDYKISMGVFRDRAGADSIAQRARRLGYEVDVSDRFRPGTTYWLGIELVGGQQADIRSIQSDAGRIIRSEPVDCTPAGAGEGPALPG